MNFENTKQTGAHYEALAQQHLEKQGLKLIEKNFEITDENRQGEIDLIMQDKTGREPYHVFVEVRYRKKPSHGNALESISQSKIKNIIRTSKYYLLDKKLYDKVNVRYDVVAFEKNEQDIQWVPNAFWAGWN